MWRHGHWSLCVRLHCAARRCAPSNTTCPPTIVIVGLIAPDLGGRAAIEAPRAFLWPPNHKMRTIALTFRADDNCEPVPLSNLSLELRSNQPDTGFDSGHTSGDTNGEDGHVSPVIVPSSAITQNAAGSFTATFELRAERSDAMPGSRIYTAAVVSSDTARPAIRSTRIAAQFVVQLPGRGQ